MDDRLRQLASVVEALVVIGVRGKVRPISGRALAEELGVPPRFLEQTLQQLVRADILKSVRGPRGGYLLQREKPQVTLRDIDDALRQNARSDPPPTLFGRSLIAPLFTQLERRFAALMEEVSLAELCDRAQDQLARVAPETSRMTG